MHVHTIYIAVASIHIVQEQTCRDPQTPFAAVAIFGEGVKAITVSKQAKLHSQVVNNL